MKSLKTISLILLSISLVATPSCMSKAKCKRLNAERDEMFGGKYPLKRINVKETDIKTSTGWFFLVGGRYSSEETTEVKIRLYFKNYRGEYTFLEMPFDNVRIKTEQYIGTPYIRFTSVPKIDRSDTYEDNDFDRLLRWYGRDGIVIHCKESDFTPEININDLR